MRFSKTELQVISQLGNGNTPLPNLAKALHISPSQLYRIAQTLHQKGFLSLKEGVLQPERKTHVTLLLKILSEAVNLSTPLSGTGLQIYTSLLEPKTIKEVEAETGLHKTTVLKKINQGRKMSLVIIKDNTYHVNEKIWPAVRETLVELQKYEQLVDQRVPANSIIYWKNKF